MVVMLVGIGFVAVLTGAIAQRFVAQEVVVSMLLIRRCRLVRPLEPGGRRVRNSP
jgi:hypothetical protein